MEGALWAGRDEHTKELFNNCLKDKEHVPDLFKIEYLNTRRTDIHSYFIRGSIHKNLVINAIRLEVAKSSFLLQGCNSFLLLNVLVFDAFLNVPF